MAHCHECGMEVEPGLYTCPRCGAMPAVRGPEPPGGALVQFCLTLGQMASVLGCLVGLFQIGAGLFFAQRFGPLLGLAGSNAAPWWGLGLGLLPGLIIFGLSAGLWGAFTQLKHRSP